MAQILISQLQSGIPPRNRKVASSQKHSCKVTLDYCAG
jgi:hypothetical protein